jgi:hypothetical protein
MGSEPIVAVDAAVACMPTLRTEGHRFSPGVRPRRSELLAPLDQEAVAS